MNTLNSLGARRTAAMIANGEITSRELVEACLARIAARDAEVGAFVAIDPDVVLAAAKARDASGPLGPLHGVPFAAKDIMDSRDHPTGWGSPIYAGHKPERNASAIQLLKDAGGILIGKTVTTEFAYFNPGKTANPRNTAHTPGGSSSGSAAAVADDMVPIALGTQTAGSLIRPGAYCGVLAYKPSFATFDLSGTMSLAPSLDTLGGFARRVEDLGLLHSLLVPRSDILDRMQTPADWRPRVTLMRGPHWEEAGEASRETCRNALLGLSAAGAQVGEMATPEAYLGLTEHQKTIMAYEAARARLYEFRNHRAMISDAFASLIETGLATSHADYVQAQSAVARARRIHAAIMTETDALLAPASPGEAPAGLAATGDPLHSRAWTALHVPCVSVPSGVGPKGLPMAVQLVGQIGQEAVLLGAANWTAARIGTH